MLYCAIILILNILEHPSRSSTHATICLLIVQVADCPLVWRKQLILRIFDAVSATVRLANFGGLFVICLYRHVFRRFIYVVGIIDIQQHYWVLALKHFLSHV